MPVSGFVAPGGELPEDAVEDELRALTAQYYELMPITRGTYAMTEEDLPDAYKELLHGRAFVIDREEVTESDSASARTYYIAADKVQGLIIPARSMVIDIINGDGRYRWTDDGEHFTDWITIESGVSDDYSPQSKNRFAEVQVYATSGSPLVSIRASR